MKGSADMRKFKMGIRRLGASFAAFLMVCCLSAPAFAANNWPVSPADSDFRAHPNSWYVWQRKSISVYSGYELICGPVEESSKYPDSLSSAWFPYSTDSGTWSYSSSNFQRTYMYAVPYIPRSDFGYLSDFPVFPVGEPSFSTAVLRVYPVKWRGYLNGISDVFSDRSVFGYLTSWPSNSSSSSYSDYFNSEVLDYNPIYVPSNIFFFGDKTDTSTNHTSFSIQNGDNNFWATPSNNNYLHLSKSHLSTPGFRSFPSNFSIPSSDVGLVFCKRPSGDGMHVYNSEFNVSLSFGLSLWVPDALLPADVAVGDWISKADVESLQDQLVKDFDVNSDTLKNSKNNFDSWQNSNTIDTDVADTGLNIINGLMQNVGQFAFIVSLLCFGAVVLRVLIRKAVEG